MVDPRSARLRSLPAVLPAIRRRGHSNGVASPFPWSNHRKLHPLYGCRSHIYAAESPGLPRRFAAPVLRLRLWRFECSSSSIESSINPGFL
jgi:hypothetical protein